MRFQLRPTRLYERIPVGDETSPPTTVYRTLVNSKQGLPERETTVRWLRGQVLEDVVAWSVRVCSGYLLSKETVRQTQQRSFEEFVSRDNVAYGGYDY